MATSYDYAPLFRSSVGFDRVFNLLENAQRARSISDWPPYDIVRTGDDSYRISIAVAGFAQDELDITFQSNLLTVTGKKQEVSTDGYLYRGIAGRPFEHRFELADHVRVNGADLKNGLLSMDLVREVPEEMKPRKIAIETAPALQPSAPPAQIEAKKAA
ncbi:molecular chaperone Hsp20 [Rhizobium leguminosarum bv. trifolii]|uniref:Hsp20 family protein n=1 Tax=Rhizobium leguminosarum TaxID=384 RepID=UPI000E2EE29E|nr:Hsp20 family protein [Rhizobium leguminosarum]RFB96942.1 molecular chaperone Hsp20 [Rhizobium leguminosarum bv. trifolii]